MGSKQRIVSAFEHKAPDRTPCFEYCLLSREITESVLKRTPATIDMLKCMNEKGWEGAVRQLAMDQLELAEFFGFDMMYVLPHCLPPEPEDQPHKKAEKKEADIASDPVEAVAESNKKTRENGFDVDDRSFIVYEILNDEMEKRGKRIPILAPAYRHGIWTNIDLMQTMILEPEIAHEHFALATEGAENLIEKYFDLGVEMIGIGGDFAGNTPLISPECYSTFITPELKKLSEKIHQNNSYAVNASDGNLWSVLDAFLVDSGVDGYLEIDLHAGMDLKKLKENYGDKTTFLGNMDCGNTLSFASPQEVAEATVKCIEDGLGNGGHIFTASNAITDSVPVENYFAMVNAYRNYWNLPELKLP